MINSCVLEGIILGQPNRVVKSVKRKDGSTEDRSFIEFDIQHQISGASNYIFHITAWGRNADYIGENYYENDTIVLNCVARVFTSKKKIKETGQEFTTEKVFFDVLQIGGIYGV